MLSLTTAQNHIPIYSHLTNYPLTLSPIHLPIFNKPHKIHIKSVTLTSPFLFNNKEFNQRAKFRNSCNSWRCWCKQSETESECEGDIELEEEIMGFMRKSEKPTIFPTKGDLIEAGRWDLVEAIKKRGGWFSLGWDDDENVENVGVVEKDSVEGGVDNDIDEFKKRVESCKETASSLRDNDGSFVFDDGEGEDLESPLRERGAGANASGIEGILSGLEKQRNKDFGINLPKYGRETSLTSTADGNLDRIDFGEKVKGTTHFHQKGGLNTPNGQSSPNVRPESWRTWSYQRAGFQDTEFEAAEISFRGMRVNGDKDINCDGKTVTSEEYDVAMDKTKEIDPNDIRTRLQYLELELTTALSSFRSKREQNIQEQAIGNSDELLNVSDAWEFQENEFISAQEKLRSIRAKLAILEGKMALSIIEAQKVVEEKQNRIDGARKALQLLRTTCVVWPNSASEVLLAGSFDGWTTQRKMEKSRSGIFSVYLKLYPGRYEIKFIVDGTWKVDPLRPMVNNNGHDNNLLIVT